MTNVASLPRTPVFGTPRDKGAAVRALLGASSVTAMYVLAVRLWSSAPPPGRLEIFGTATSLACVWLTRKQNIWAIIFGLASVMAMGVFFFEIDLVGQGWLHLGFYIPVQIVGWWAWLRGGEGRTDLPVGWLSAGRRVLVVGGCIVGTFGLAAIFQHLHGSTPYLLWDASIVAASIAAQVLLTTKRIESWWLWLVPVDVSAILLYLRSDAKMFAALYCLYLVLATLGLRDWTRAWRAQESGLAAAQARFGRVPSP